MIRSAAGKVTWMARATTTMFGLAIMLAVVFGAATTALGADGDLFRLGSAKNVATRATALVGKVTTGPALAVNNPSGGAALGLRVDAGKAPLTVNPESGTATGLSADELDGMDSSDLVPSLWAKVKDDGTLLAGKGVASVRTGGGGYFVRFDRAIADCAYVATVGQYNAAYADPGEIQATHNTNAGSPDRDVFVAVNDGDTGALSRGFSLVVVC